MAAETAQDASTRPALYITIVLLVAVTTFACKLRFDGLFSCPATHVADTFVADCESGGYGDYDHGAFWFDLEPSARRAAHDASVLFLGSSRMQFGFSTQATTQWFSSPPTSYYLLGFSHTENVRFVAPLLDRIRPLARAYVINVDRFFSEAATPPTDQLLNDPVSRANYTQKRFWQQLQEPVCRALPAFCGSKVTIFRQRDTGAWHLVGTPPGGPADVGDGPTKDADRWNQFAATAERFVNQLPVERQCVILTLVPYRDTKRAEAQAVADALGLQLFAPDVSDLRTIDGSHLNPESAERWSAKFYSLAGPQIRRCLTSGESAPSDVSGI